MPLDTIIGTGPDAVVLQVSQDAFQGDAQYSVFVDGVPLDGILTATALRSAGATETVTALGNFTAGPHTVAVAFLNDAWGGTAETDRNLYVESVRFEGAILPDSAAAFFVEGTQAVGTFTEAVPVVRSIGSGADALTLRISQDDWLGNAEYALAVDGVPVDGVLTASAERQFAAADTITVRGDFGAGPHALTVDFLNDAWGGTAQTDRNLYLEGVTLNGVVQPDSVAALYSGGPQTFGFGPPVPVEQTIGAGPDRLVLHLSQDAWLGSAQYTLAVDGQPVDGVLTASALHGLAQQDTITVLGDWDAGPHQVTVTFLNDAWDGTPETDRNLYVDGIAYNGAPQPDGTAALLSQGPWSFGFVDTSDAAKAVVLDKVPAYDWYHGCGPTAVASVFGYWDVQGYSTYFDAEGWDAVRLTAKVRDQISSPAHNAKYDPSPDDPTLPDPPDTSIADFTHTSENQDYGWTWLSDIAPGIEGYASHRGQPLDAWSEWIGAVTWDEIVHQIDTGHPMVFLVDSSGDGGTDHFVPVVGYEDRGAEGRWYGAYTTWSEDEQVEWFQFRPMAAEYAWGVGYVTFITDPSGGETAPDNGFLDPGAAGAPGGAWGADVWA